ncbi:hypothetical protein [Carboxylicivirga marina]|uniref:Class IIb bacteriocin, lactobin A/cerein 7B family n=2 Tax=Carboxylicivirga marina TaxID=2800988 RepID=A0ABS1HE44_9BACT|nr:hypothetical protein [Carboxylicivirga marina]MBK3515909.1 hypothetical protein [Carboxylicivirga marina]
MKNLNELGVQEMDAKEVNSTVGGVVLWVLGAIAGGMIYDYLNNSSECNAAMAEGFERGMNRF